MPPPGFKAVTVPERVHKKLTILANALAWTDQIAVEQCIDAILDMASQPHGQKLVPKPVVMLAAVRANDVNPEKVKETPSSPVRTKNPVVGPSS